VLANSSPGSSFGNPGIKTVRRSVYPERVLCVSDPFQGLEGIQELLCPRVVKANPGLELANTFGVDSLF
jgi:hypothetical protein